MPICIHRYSAIHTVVFISGALLLNLVDWLGLIPPSLPTQVGLDDFDTVIGKSLFTITMFIVVIPVFVNVFAMLGNMISRGRWAWVFCTILFAFLSTAIYYFVDYRNQDEHLT